MKRKKMKPIPPEVKERWERNQRALAERIAELEKRIAARESGSAPPQS
jgi:hypothetical protein